MTVVKIGGSLLERHDMRAGTLRELAARGAAAGPMVVVHGGGRRVDAVGAALGLPKRAHQGLRITDAATLEVVVSVLAGLVNKEIVSELAALGLAAAGFSGADGGTLRAVRHPGLDGVDLGHVGRVTACDPGLIRSVLKGGLLPVVASIAIDRNGALLNVNADAAAAALAVGLKARRLVFLTDVEGLMDGSGRVVPRLATAEARRLLGSPFVAGGMRPKLGACLEALAGGVAEVVIAGPARHASALRRGAGGTRFVAA